MSTEDIKLLKQKITDLESELQLKNHEITVYKKELAQFSYNLDLVLSSSKQDIKKANELHLAIVPIEIPQFPGFEISRKFTYGTQKGGDYFDIYPHEDKMKFGILLASSSGYSQSSAFLSVILQESQMLEAKKNVSVSDTIEKIGLQLQKLTDGKNVTHLFYAVVDRRHMTMTFVCTGFIKGVLYDQTGDNELKIISSDSSGIRAHEKIDSTSIEIDLTPGLRFGVISEGLTSILSEDELADIFESTSDGNVHEIRNQILIQAQIKSGLDQPLQDQTVIIMDVKDNIVTLAKTKKID